MRARVTRDGVVCAKNSPFGINGKGIQLGSPTPVMAPDMIDSPVFYRALIFFVLQEETSGSWLLRDWV